MGHHLQDLYFSANCLLARGLSDFALFVGFYGYFLVSGSVNGDPYRSVGTLSDDLADNIVLFELGSEVVSGNLYEVFLVLGILLRQTREHLVKIVNQPEKLYICEIPPTEEPNGFARLVGFSFDFVLFFGVMEELLEVLLGH